MPTPSVSILYALAGLVWIAVVAVEPDLSAAPASLLLAPILYLAGGRMRGLLAGFDARDALVPIAQVILGTFLIGGVLHVLEPTRGSFSGESGIASSLLLGLAISLADPTSALLGARTPARPSRPAGLGRLLSEQALLTLAIGALASPVLGRFLGPASESADLGREFLFSLLDLAKGLAAGAGVGLAGWAALAVFRDDLSRSAVHLLLAAAAVVAAAALGSGAAPLSALAAGLLACAGVERGGVLSLHRARRAPASDPGDADLAAAPVLIATGAGLFILSMGRLGLARIGGAVTAGAALWLGSVVLRFLVHFGFGGLRRLGRPGEVPARWLPALAWCSHPGPASLGLFLAARVAGGAGTGGEALPSHREAALVVAVLIALLIQGATAAVAAARAERSPFNALAKARKMKLDARAIALRAERREVGELRSRGWLDESAAGALEEAIRASERQVELEEEEVLAGEPRLRAEELTRATRRVLEAAQRAVEEARDGGQIDDAAAREVGRELERLLLRSDSAPLAELLGAPPPPDPGEAGSAAARGP